MELLYLDQGEIKWVPEILKDKTFKVLYTSDKHKGKPLFSRWMTYIYYCYSKTGKLYRGMLPTDRKRYVCTNILDGDKELWKEYDKKFADAIKVYIDSEYDVSEALVYKTIVEMDKFIRYLQDIPFSVIRIKKEKGEEAIEVEEPNDIKLKAIKMAKELIEMKKGYEEMLKNEKKSSMKYFKHKFEDPI